MSDHTYPHDPELDEHDLGTLLADRETLRAVTEELVDARILLGTLRRSLTPRAEQSLAEGAGWVRLERTGALALLEAKP